MQCSLILCCRLVCLLLFVMPFDNLVLVSKASSGLCEPIAFGFCCFKAHFFYYLQEMLECIDQLAETSVVRLLLS